MLRPARRLLKVSFLLEWRRRKNRGRVEMRISLVVLALTVLAGCATVEPTGGVPMPLINSAGQTIGSVRAWEAAGSVSFRITATGLPHGLHGIHVHAVGRCDPPGFESAGPHWNPANRQHGTANPNGPHYGDLGNLSVAGDGVGNVSATTHGGTMAELNDADGAAV